MKVLVTGGNGFLGFHIVKLLLKEGHEVTSLSRSYSSKLDELGIPWIKGDIQNLDDLNKAFRGQEAIFHVASKVSMWGKWSDFYNINVLGTENVIKACELNNIKKIIYTSTPSVVFGSENLENVDESISYPKSSLGLYGKSKRIAEEKILAYNGHRGAMTICLRPHLILGSDDPNIIPRILEKSSKNKLAVVGNGKNLVDFIHVQNAAYAHLLALKSLTQNSPTLGQVYFLGQEKPVYLWNFINKILGRYKFPPIQKKVPFFMAYVLGYFCEFFFTLFKIYDREPPMTRFIALQFAKSHYFNHKKSLKDLGNYIQLNIEESLEEIRPTIH